MSQLEYYLHKMSSQTISDLAGTYPSSVVVLNDRTVWRMVGESVNTELTRIDNLPEMQRSTTDALAMYDDLTRSVEIGVVVLSDHAVRKETVLRQLETAQGRQVA